TTPTPSSSTSSPARPSRRAARPAAPRPPAGVPPPGPAPAPLTRSTPMANNPRLGAGTPGPSSPSRRLHDELAAAAAAVHPGVVHLLGVRRRIQERARRRRAGEVRGGVG